MARAAVLDGGVTVSGKTDRQPATSLGLLQDTIAATLKMTKAWAAIPADASPAGRSALMVASAVTCQSELDQIELRALRAVAASPPWPSEG